MIVLKTKHELEVMRDACRISAQALQYAGELVKPGLTTGELDLKIEHFIRSQGAVPSFKGYGGFSGSACLSINNEIIHGIPSPYRMIHEGDIVSVDVGAFYNGYHGDNAATFPAGRVSEEAQALMDATKQSLYEGIRQAIPGNRIGDIGHAVQEYVEARGFSVVREYVGHGVGKELHESPEVPNFGQPGRGVRLAAGMVIAIEPMINAGRRQVKQMPDGWTVVTADGSLSAHFEHTIAITDNGPVILTQA